MLEKVMQRLTQLGYTSNSSFDTSSILFYIDKVSEQVCNFCNSKAVPIELNNTVADKICGDFLFMKKSAGLITTEQMAAIHLIATPTEIKLGDTTVKLSDPTPEQQFDRLIHSLTDDFSKKLVPFRKLRW